MLIPSAALYLDLAAEAAVTDTPVLINTFPYDGQTDVAAADAPGSSELHMTVVATGVSGLSPGDTHVYVTTVEDGLLEVFDGTNFAAGWLSSSYVALASDGGGTIDEHRLVLVRDTPFTSLDLVTVRVTAETLAADLLDQTYSFTVEDLTAPELVSVKTRGLTHLRVLFNEPMLQAEGRVGDALYVRDVSGGATMRPPTSLLPARLELTRDAFTADDVGMFVGVAGAENAINNGVFEILTVLSARTVEIDQTLVTEEVLPADVLITVSPYRVIGVSDPQRVLPFFEPLVTAAERVSAEEIELTLHTEITPGRAYVLRVVKVEDLYGNQI